MGLLDKVRDFFYDDEEVEEIPKKQKIKSHKEKIVLEETKTDKHHKKDKQEISERELFKAERTFNFPLDMTDEDFVEEKKESKPEIKKEEIKPVKKENNYSDNKNISIRNYSKYEKKEEEPVKKFKPTPVISPIYGILDKNYKKEDLLIDSTMNENKKKKADYETVRKRAYSNVYKEDEEEKGIFYNLDKEDKNEEEVKIIYNDVTFEEEEKEDDKNKTIGEKIEEYEKSLEEDKEQDENDDNILSETKEQDLFNLIDNMYNSDEEEDEEEE